MMMALPTTLIRGRAQPLARPALWSLCRLALTVRAERRALSRLDHRALSDLGLTPAQVHAEASRPFWDLPSRTIR